MKWAGMLEGDRWARSRHHHEHESRSSRESGHGTLFFWQIRVLRQTYVFHFSPTTFPAITLANMRPYSSSQFNLYCAGTNSAVMPEIAAWENYHAGEGRNERGLKHGWRSVTLSLITASLAAVLSHVDNSSRTDDKNTCSGYSWKNSVLCLHRLHYTFYHRNIRTTGDEVGN